MVMLMQMLPAGAMSGGGSWAISRALGAGDVDRAEVLAFHALVIGAAAGACSRWSACRWRPSASRSRWRST
jgi:Na+-driven multidrug efflux pump